MLEGCKVLGAITSVFETRTPGCTIQNVLARKEATPIGQQKVRFVEVTWCRKAECYTPRVLRMLLRKQGNVSSLLCCDLLNMCRKIHLGNQKVEQGSKIEAKPRFMLNSPSGSYRYKAGRNHNQKSERIGGTKTDNNNGAWYRLQATASKRGKTYRAGNGNGTYLLNSKLGELSFTISEQRQRKWFISKLATLKLEFAGILKWFRRRW
jgi:hypothetical protein